MVRERFQNLVQVKERPVAHRYHEKGKKRGKGLNRDQTPKIEDKGEAIKTIGEWAITLFSVIRGEIILIRGYE